MRKILFIAANERSNLGIGGTLESSSGEAGPPGDEGGCELVAVRNGVDLVVVSQGWNIDGLPWMDDEGRASASRETALLTTRRR
jgi:hypothetical protein